VKIASVETDRLLLRPLTPDDLDELAAVFAVEKVHVRELHRRDWQEGKAT
jgi:hypothetical protein